MEGHGSSMNVMEGLGRSWMVFSRQEQFYTSITLAYIVFLIKYIVNPESHSKLVLFGNSVLINHTSGMGKIPTN